jgi:hypothetical protein
VNLSSSSLLSNNTKHDSGVSLRIVYIGLNLRLTLQGRHIDADYLRRECCPECLDLRLRTLQKNREHCIAESLIKLRRKSLTEYIVPTGCVKCVQTFSREHLKMPLRRPRHRMKCIINCGYRAFTVSSCANGRRDNHDLILHTSLYCM